MDDVCSSSPYVWLICLTRSIVNAAAAASPIQPIVNMGQGFLYDSIVSISCFATYLKFTRSGYNPPPFVIDAAKHALDRVECNQYSPTTVQRPASVQSL